jgi:hypothetical protein
LPADLPPTEARCSCEIDKHDFNCHVHNDLSRVAPSVVAPERLDLPRKPQPDGSLQTCGMCGFRGDRAAYIPHDCYWVLRDRRGRR